MKKWVKIPLLLLCSLLLIGNCYYCIKYGTVRVSSKSSECYSEAQLLLERAKSAVTNNSAKKLDLSTNNSQTIYNSGIYEISGTSTNASIKINTNGSVILLLNNVNLSNSSEAVVNVEDAESVLIYTVENTDNTITSGEEVEITSLEEDLSGSAIYSKDNLFFGGDGTLNVNGYINNAIASNDSLLVLSGTYNINSINNGIKAHDYLEIYDGTINIVSGNDGIKAINDEDQTLGIVNISGGTINITPLGDGISAVSNLLVENGTLNITSPNYTESISHTESEPGGGMGGQGGGDMKQGGDKSSLQEPPSGDFSGEMPSMSEGDLAKQDSTSSQKGDQTPPSKPDEDTSEQATSGESMPEMPSDDENKPNENMGQGAEDPNTESTTESDGESNKGLKVDKTLTINGGTITIATQDDAIHSNDSVSINGGTLNLSTDDDGIHGDGVVTINGGTITITNSYEGIEGHQIYVNDGTIDLYSTDDGFNASGESDCLLEINGGNILVNAAGDGLDSNGDLIINGGYTIVNGPTNAGNGPLDSGSENGGEILVNGGEILAIGASGMDEGFESTSGQPSIHLQTDSSYDTGSTITISDDQGNVLFTYTTIKSSVSSIVYSSPSLTNGTTYTITVNDDTYSLTMEDNLASNATSSMGGGGMGGQGGGNMGQGGNMKQGGNMGGQGNH